MTSGEPIQRQFRQVDVFTTTPYAGNPVAVVLDAEGLTTDQMQRFTRWTNLSEATFVLPPNESDADYRVRIFTSASETDARKGSVSELPFAGLSASGKPKQDDLIVQECPAGLVPVRRSRAGLAFAAPPLIRSGPIEEPLVEEIASMLRIDRGQILDAAWADN